MSQSFETDSPLLCVQREQSGWLFCCIIPIVKLKSVIKNVERLILGHKIVYTLFINGILKRAG